ncbi:MAG: hypothetical protein QME66_00545 [Candidatus Eisenbacteria bacterium]|nr:hypothetical protein [Candidatus Eisenbacteria bacterium]
MHARISFTDIHDLDELAELIIRWPHSFENGYSVILKGGEKKLPPGLIKASQKERSYLVGIDCNRKPVSLCISLEPSDGLFLELLDIYLWEKKNPWFFSILFPGSEAVNAEACRIVVAAPSFPDIFLERMASFSSYAIELFELRVVLLGKDEKYPVFNAVNLSRIKRVDAESLPAFFSQIEPDKLRNLAMRAAGRIQKLFPGVSLKCERGRIFVEAFQKPVATIQAGRGFLEFSLDGGGAGPMQIQEAEDIEEALRKLREKFAVPDEKPKAGLLTIAEIMSLGGSSPGESGQKDNER